MIYPCMFSADGRSEPGNNVWPVTRAAECRLDGSDGP